jgi:hypothetical protein
MSTQFVWPIDLMMVSPPQLIAVTCGKAFACKTITAKKIGTALKAMLYFSPLQSDALINQTRNTAACFSAYRTVLRKLIFLAAFVLLLQGVQAQYWQQRVDYQLEATLNDSSRTLDGFATIIYYNNSPDTLRYIPFHLWPNAYKNDGTALSEQLLRMGQTGFYFAGKEQRGYINRLDFKVNGARVQVEAHPQYIDVVSLLLEAPLPPGGNIRITTPFFVKLPFNFSRGGYDGNSFQLTQWYPKPAVYDGKGWHPMPYLHQGEFYSDFGRFDVRITLPAQYKVAATGLLQEATFTENENIAAVKKAPKNKKSVTPVRKPTKPATPPVAKSLYTKADSTISGMQTLRFVQDSVHDFALFAAPNYIVQKDTCRLPSGRVIVVQSYYTAAQQKVWQSSIAMLKEAVRYRSRLIGEYPFGVVTAVLGPESFGGGMEYPTITVISPQQDPLILAELIGHELGHNWFQGILASNERAHAWLDEGLNSYYDRRHRRERATGSPINKNVPDLGLLLNRGEELLLQTKVRQKLSQPINSKAEDFTPLNYLLVSYTKTALWLESLEARIGRNDFDKAMQAYYNQWKFRHPYPEDFKQVLEDHSGLDLSSFFSHLNEKGVLNDTAMKGFRVASTLAPKSIAAYLRKPTQTLLLVSPALGFNQYDRLMAGALFTNYKIPPSGFQFVAVPLYAFGSKQINGIGRAGYNWYTGGPIRRTELFVNAARFASNVFEQENGNQQVASFFKLAPGIRATFREQHPASTRRTSVHWKSYFIREGAFRFGTDTLVQNGDTSTITTARTVQENRTLHQLRFTLQDLRELYPYKAEFQIEAGKQFIRPALSAHYFLNYGGGGGLDARFFGGVLLFTNGRTLQKEFAADRYQLNMTGPDGYHDYTYSNYFIGRNEFEGFSSQQILMRDGGFKMRTDLLAQPVGRSAKWLMALNFSSSLPDKINPLSVLPFKIPLRLFADVGTYAEAWNDRQEGSRFLFDAGLQLPLFGELVQVYLPLLYSAPFRDYQKSYLTEKRFLKTLSFSIQLNQRPLNKIFREVDL